MENDIVTLIKQPTKELKSNLTYKEHSAMEELAKRKILIITNIDKGGMVVIIDIEGYIKKANRQLSDKISYKQLIREPRLQYNRMVKQWIDGQKQKITS